MGKTLLKNSVIDTALRRQLVMVGKGIAPMAHAVRLTVALALLGIVAAAAPANANELKPQTLRAWQNYVESAEAGMESRANGNGHFLRVDESPEQADRVRSGEPLITGSGPFRVPHGLIHDWTGTIFIPSVTIGSVAQVLGEYDRYREFYDPLVVGSSLINRTPAQDLVTLTMIQKAFSVTAAVKIEDEIQTIFVDPERVYSVSRSIRVQEISNYGRPDEHFLPEGRGPGYVWETFTTTLLEQRDGGVFEEMEMVELSRGIPFEFSWLLGPLTERLPRTIMNTMLADTKVAVERKTQFYSKAANAPPTSVRVGISKPSTPERAPKQRNTSCQGASPRALSPFCRQNQPLP